MSDVTPTTSSPSSERTTCLALQDIVVRFGGIVALGGLSLQVDSGEVCGLIGPNGAGKTTMFDVASGIRRPASGRVLLGGEDVSSRGPAKRCAKGLRRTFQRVQTFGWLTVEENVLTALDAQGGGGGFLGDVIGSATRKRRELARREAVSHALERCGLTDVKDEYAGALPIGIGRMVEFARATVEPPRILLLDEPASGLDDREVELLGEQIQQVRSETGCAVLLIEHNAGFVMQQSDRVFVLAQGMLLAEGTPAEIQADPVVRAAYLGDTHPTDAESGPS